MLGVGTILFLFLLITVFTLNSQIKLHETEDYIIKRGECLKMANLINSVYINGPGTEVRTHTDFIITAYNGSQISVGEIGAIEESGNEPRIAFLASEAGPTSEEFYNRVNEDLDPDPDWYLSCFDDIGVPGCTGGASGWMASNIQYNIDDLMNNLSNYNTIYLEDAHIQYTTDYIERLSNWVQTGNALILSEHTMCRESTGTFSSNSYRCDVPGITEDVWDIFGVRLYEEDSAWGYTSSRTNVIVNDTDEAFDLVLGDQLSFEERSYLENINATNYKTIAKYIDSFRLRESRDKPAIAFWDYGNGKIFYFSDFQVNYMNLPGKSFSQVLVDLISIAYYLIIHPELNSDITCHFSAFAPYGQVYGDIIIKNEDNYIILENVHNSSINST